VRGLSGTVYARLLRLRHIQLGQVTSFVLFEGSILVAVLLALADLVDPWAVAVIPVVRGDHGEAQRRGGGCARSASWRSRKRRHRGSWQPTVVGWSPRAPSGRVLTMRRDSRRSDRLDPQARPIPPPAGGVGRGRRQRARASGPKTRGRPSCPSRPR
jgi:hypothetical protein